MISNFSRALFRSGLAAACIVLSGTADADSLFNQRVASKGSLVADLQVFYEEGDLITVLVRETVEASTRSDTKTKKESDVEAEADAEDNAFFVSNDGLNILNPAELPNWNIEVENEHKATGSTNRRNQLVMTVTCRVVKVLDDGNLLIEGEKAVTVNREQSLLYVAGILRPQDVSPANTASSAQLANATIALRGKGPLWNNQRRGLFTKVLDWVSPF